MASQEEIKAVRMEKLKKLESLGIELYPISVRKDYNILDLREKFEELVKAEGSAEYTAQEICIVGRIMSMRGQGALVFADVFDGTATFQTIFKKDQNPIYTLSTQKGESVSGITETLAHPGVTKTASIGADANENGNDANQSPTDAFELFKDTADMGDFIEARGRLLRTSRGEMSLVVSAWRMITKSLRPLPEKWHGLQDVEERYRRRYLDVLSNEDVRKSFILRSKLLTAVRRFYDDHGYLEVELPILQALAGGATAAVFETHHNALDLDFNLTIAQELYLKKLIVGGFNKVYEVGRRFRNEGIDTTHNPEFTMLESQEAYADAKSQRQFIQDLVQSLVRELFGVDSFQYEGQTIDTGKAFEVREYLEVIAEYAGITDVRAKSREELVEVAHKFGADIEPADEFEKIIDKIYKKAVRPKLIQPIFLINYPVEFNPFAKRREDDKTLIDRFQLVMGGLEVTNCFSELNNPVDQKDRYEDQDRKKRKGDGEISPSDQDYLEAMEYGMPPNGGIGIGIDRLAMLFINTGNIKDAILFPTMRPEDTGGSSAEKAAKKKESSVAVIILNAGAELVGWQRMNTVAHLSASFAGTAGKKLFMQESVKTADDQDIKLNIQHAILIKELGSNDALKNVLAKANQVGLSTSEFTREMIETTNDKKVIAQTKEKNFAEVEHLGVLVFGPKSLVEEATEGAVLVG
ncbi:MAG: lysine--tRNA ligase [Candidatus Pacebacteria bacterium]|nr:lysine--tRNA ligase [Candidatus Paceibacterota bacterium]